jgi:hypothetical protein
VGHVAVEDFRQLAETTLRQELIGAGEVSAGGGNGFRRSIPGQRQRFTEDG